MATIYDRVYDSAEERDNLMERLQRHRNDSTPLPDLQFPHHLGGGTLKLGAYAHPGDGRTDIGIGVYSVITEVGEDMSDAMAANLLAAPMFGMLSYVVPGTKLSQKEFVFNVPKLAESGVTLEWLLSSDLFADTGRLSPPAGGWDRLPIIKVVKALPLEHIPEGGDNVPDCRVS